MHTGRTLFYYVTFVETDLQVLAHACAIINLKQAAQIKSKALPPADIVMSINKQNDEAGPRAYI